MAEKSPLTTGKVTKYEQNLEESGIVDAYEYLLDSLCKYGLPSGDLFGFASMMVLKYQKKWKIKQRIELEERIKNKKLEREEKKRKEEEVKLKDEQAKKKVKQEAFNARVEKNKKDREEAVNPPPPSSTKKGGKGGKDRSPSPKEKDEKEKGKGTPAPKGGKGAKK